MDRVIWAAVSADRSQEEARSMAIPTDLAIASGASLTPLDAIAGKAGIPIEHLEPYGTGAAKISLGAIGAMADRPRARYVVVTAITPTPLGEGKTTTTVGLGQGFSHIGRQATIAIRQPSIGADVRDQGWGRRRGLQPGRTHGSC